MLDRIPDVAQEPVSPVIKRIAEPGPAGDRFELASVRLNQIVVARDRDRLHTVLADRLNRPAVARPSAIDLVIEPPGEIVHHRLNVVLPKPRENFLTDISLQITVRILEVPDV